MPLEDGVGSYGYLESTAYPSIPLIKKKKVRKKVFILFSMFRQIHFAFEKKITKLLICQDNRICMYSKDEQYSNILENILCI